jgi:tRNA(Ile)-lysidine synthase TilS/MesJ
MPSVLVAMSGGVDSSVAACLLKEQGYEVLGSHMRLVHLDSVDHGCCGPSARMDAAETARIAGFPFEICDLTEEFDRTVLADFATEHEAGRTPNPCARCNGAIKFGAFLRRADALGIDMVASGHYVRRAGDAAGWRLLRGVHPGARTAAAVIDRVEVDEAHVRAQYVVALLLEQARGDGRIDPAGHRDEHGRHPRRLSAVPMRTRQREGREHEPVS